MDHRVNDCERCAKADPEVTVIFEDSGDWYVCKWCATALRTWHARGRKWVVQ